MGIPNVVTANITIGSVTITEKAFGVGLIVGETAFTNGVLTDRVRTYTSIDSVLIDFKETTDEYKAALAYFSQQPAPEKLKIGIKNTVPEETYVAAMTAILQEDAGFYAIMLTTRDEVAVKDVSDWTEARNRLFYAASAGSALYTVLAANDDPRLNAEGFFLYDENGKPVKSVGDVSCIDADGKPVYNADGTPLVDAEGNKLLSESSIWGTTKANSRTVIIYHSKDGTSSEAVKEFPDAAMMSKQIAFAPGSYTMKFKSLLTISPDNKLTDTEREIAWSKGVNTYTTVAGADIIENGRTNKEWIDIINGADWIQARIEERIYLLFLKNKKIPFTDGGVGILTGVVDRVLSEAQTDLHIISPDDYDDDDNKVGGYIIKTKPVRAVPVADKQRREYKYLSFTAYLAGAIHYAKIDGILTN